MSTHCLLLAGMVFVVVVVVSIGSFLLARSSAFSAFNASSIINTTSFPFPDPYANLPEVRHSRQIPRDFSPSFYEIHLKIFVPFHEGISFGKRNMTMEGRLRLHFVVLRTNRRLLLHCKSLNISNVILRDSHSEEEIPVSFTSHQRWEVLDIITSSDLHHHHNYTVEIVYSTRIDHQRKTGIYAAPDIIEGAKRWMVTSHLQPMDARSVFPCLDVPDAKAFFQTTVEHPIDTFAISNTMEMTNSLERSSESGMTISHFERTPKMSTYLFALCISDFSYKETWFDRRVRIRIYIEKAKVNDTQVALAVVPQLLAFYENYFGIPYPLSKLDIYATPFLKVAAMENWGLVICHPRFVVYNPNIYTLSERRQVTDLLAHEIAHMWFGNLVTMKWWNNLWLNEGFAVMIAAKAADAIENVTTRNEESVVESHALTMRIDQQPHADYRVSVHPDVLVNPNTQFNKITYYKAASIIRMVERIVGREGFQDGLRHFLQRFAYSNADHFDLLSALTESQSKIEKNSLTQQNFSLAEVIETWIYQKGVPLLTVKAAPLGSPDRAVASQQKLELAPSLHSENSQWKIPLFLRDPQLHTPQVHWLCENETLELDLSEDVVLDRDVRAYVRIIYDRPTYLRIISTLQHQTHRIPVASRARLVDDSFTFAEYGFLDYQVLFRILQHNFQELAYVPVLLTNAHLEPFRVHLMHSAGVELLNKFIINIFGSHFEQSIETNKTSSLYQDSLPRSILQMLCHAGYDPCLRHGLNQFARLRNSCNSSFLSDHICNFIPTHLRTPVYMAAAMRGSGEDMEYLVEKWKAEPYSRERERLFLGLIACENKSIVYQLFRELLFNPSNPDELHQHLLEYTRFGHENNHFRSFVIDNLDALLSRFKSVYRILKIMLLAFSRSYHNFDGYEEYLRVERRFNESPGFSLPGPSQFERLTQVLTWRREMMPLVISNLTAALSWFP